jgi:hypothetical protein
MSAKVNKCVICNQIYYGEGNDASPLDNGKCCDKCLTVVKAERIYRLHSDHHMQELLIKYFCDINNEKL